MISESYSIIKWHYSQAEHASVKRWTLMLPAAGCEYHQRTGGCVMCGFYQANKKYSFGRLYPPLVFKILYKLAYLETRRRRPEELFLYNGGSFFNHREIPKNFSDYLFQAVGKHPSLKRIMIESRVEYITPERLNRAKQLLAGKTLMVGIGLESKDDHVRNHLIGKGLALKHFEKTVAVLKESKVGVLAYVFLKPLGLSEEEAAADAWETIKYCHSLGIDEVELSCAFIQEGTKMAAAYERGEFSPPTLWTIVEIIRKTASKGLTISIGNFGDEPPPIAIPRNDCPDNCSPEIYRLIDDYRTTGRFDFLRLPNCACRPS